MSNTKVWIPDFSEHQGKINWPKLKVPGVIIRIGYGNDIASQDDVYARYNLSEAKRLGIPYAVYIYGYASTEAEVMSEIAHTKRVCKGYDPVYYFYDAEERSVQGIWGKASELWKKAFGEKAGVYTWQWGFEKHVKHGIRWVCAYGKNNGKPDNAYKPTIEMGLWQFTSRYSLSGVSGSVDMSECYIPFGKAKPVKLKQERRAVTKKELAAIIFRHLCTHREHGYTQDMSKRWGTGKETIDVYGHKIVIAGGDRDCSSAVISAFESAGISCGGATYTGDMKECMVATKNFRVRPMSFIAQTTDVYLHEECHTAMCMSSEPDILGEFSINEKGGVLGGKQGDQKQVGEYDEKLGRGESHLAPYYDYGKNGWDCILECVNNEVAFWIGDEDNVSEKVSDYSKASPTSSKKEIARLTAKTILGEFGNNPGRKKKLGDKADVVQNSVNTALGAHRDGLVDAMADYIERII